MPLREIKTKTEHYWIDDNNLKQGEYKYFFRYGGLKIQAYYLDGLLHGTHQQWFSNGNLEVQQSFIQHRLHGETKEWYFTGELFRHCFYVEQKLHGEYIEFGRTGRVMCHAIFVHGNRLPQKPYKLSKKQKFILTLKHELIWR